jgi:hypothetical protein
MYARASLRATCQNIAWPIGALDRHIARDRSATQENDRATSINEHSREPNHADRYPFTRVYPRARRQFRVSDQQRLGLSDDDTPRDPLSLSLSREREQRTPLSLVVLPLLPALAEQEVQRGAHEAASRTTLSGSRDQSCKRADNQARAGSRSAALSEVFLSAAYSGPLPLPPAPPPNVTLNGTLN